MQVTVSARHGHLDQGVKDQLHEKAEKLLHFFDRLIAIGVTVDLHPDKSGRLAVEVLAEAEHKHEFVATETDADVLLACTHAVAKVTQQIKHYKEKLQDHRRDPSHNDPNRR